jgi:predicted ATPase
MEQQQSPLLSRVVESLQYRSSCASSGKLRSTKSQRNELDSDSTKKRHFNLSKNKVFVGRDEESRQLQECLNRIIEQQSTELIVIHGTSGCGKSSLVQSFARNLPPEVLYVEGKFDQLQSHAPYSALVAASDQLCRQILNKNNSSEIRDRVRSVLGPEVNLLGNLIPKLVQISEDDTDQVSIQNREENMGNSFKRFKQIFRSFLRSVAASENPLILFLDDIQWADHASLDVLKSILTDTFASNMLIICAYREGEISMDVLQEYRLTDDTALSDDDVSRSSSSSIYSIRITDIALHCLDAMQLNELISITLEMESSSTMSLSQLIWKKTDGNPFYVLNFLETIHRRGLLSTACNGEWNWDESQIMQMTNVSQNLASILESRMQNLPEQVRTILQVASFIGHEFPSVVLITIVLEEQDTIATEYSFERKSKETIQEWITLALNVAVNEGLLEKTSRDDEYKFAHDKIQEALYEGLMPDEMERQLLHQRIGTLIWNSVKDKDISQIDDCFVLLAADNLNHAANIFDYSGDRYYLIELNLIAAKRIINKSAFLLASEYIRLAISLLQPDVCWDERYDLCLDLFNTAAETEKNIGCYSRSADLVAIIHQHAKLLHHRSKAFVIEMDSLTTQGYIKDSIILGLNVLHQFGVRFPRKITNVVVAKELVMAKISLGRRKLEDLLSLHEVTDETALLSLSIMNIVAINAFVLNDVYKETFAAICLRMFRFTLKYGISKMYTPITFAFWGSIHAALGDFDASIESERLAISLIEKYDLNSIRGTTNIINLGFNHFWREKLDSVARNELLLSYKLAMSYGYISFAQLGFNAWVCTGLYLDDQLSDLHQVVRIVVNEMREFDSKSGLAFLLPLWQVVSFFIPKILASCTFSF